MKVLINKFISPWLIAYFIVILAFALVYWAVWRLWPDSFIVNEQLNLAPIEEIHDVATEEEPATSAEMNLSRLEELRLAYTNALVDLDDQLLRLVGRVDAAEKAFAELAKGKADAAVEDYRAAVEGKLAGLLEQRDQARRAIEVYNRLGEDVSAETGSYLQQKRAKKRQELARLEYDIADAKLQLIDQAVSLAALTGNAGLAEDLKAVRTDADALKKSFATTAGLKDSVRREMAAEVRRAQMARHARLGLLDFVYFSFVTATTTGYGDIVPNSGVGRLAVVSEVFLCLILFSILLSRLTSHPTVIH